MEIDVEEKQEEKMLQNWVAEKHDFLEKKADGW